MAMPMLLEVATCYSHTHTNACKTPNVNLVKSIFNLALTVTLNVTLNLIPHKKKNWRIIIIVIREWLASSYFKRKA